MQKIQLNDLIIPEERARKEFNAEAHNNLVKSIRSLGLFQAPLVQDDGKTLVSGERRVRAIRAIAEAGETFLYNGETFEPGTLPVVSHHDVASDELLEIEIEENVCRQDLSWQEKSKAIRRLHELRTRQAKETGQTHTTTDTMNEVYASRGLGKAGGTAAVHRANQDILLSDWLEDPDVKKAKTKKEALKIVEKKVTSAYRKSLAEKFDTSKVTTRHTLTQGDLFEEMPKLPDASFDLLIFDPPYGVGADKFKGMSGAQHVYEDTTDYADKVIRFIVEEGLRITKPDAHLYMFCDIERFFALRTLIEHLGWQPFKTPFIWDRWPSGVVPRPGYGPRRSYEAILFAMRGDKKVTDVFSDVLRHGQTRDTDRAAKKPVTLYQDLISRSCLAGEKVIDPCCGTGPIFAAAEATKTIATGIELEDTGYAYAAERLRNIAEGGKGLEVDEAGESEISNPFGGDSQ